MTSNNIRKTSQYQLPVTKRTTSTAYDVYPAHRIEDKISIGYDTLAGELGSTGVVRLDGFVGILFEDVRERLNHALEAFGVSVRWINVAQAMFSTKKINKMIEPFLGGDDPVFGKICTYSLEDLFDHQKLVRLAEDDSAGLTIFYGTGQRLFRYPVR